MCLCSGTVSLYTAELYSDPPPPPPFFFSFLYSVFAPLPLFTYLCIYMSEFSLSVASLSYPISSYHFFFGAIEKRKLKFHFHLNGFYTAIIFFWSLFWGEVPGSTERFVIYCFQMFLFFTACKPIVKWLLCISVIFGEADKKIRRKEF